jgi:hypothetical protein
LRQALGQLARLVEVPHPDVSIEKGKAEADTLIAETSKSFDQARRYIELTQFEFKESPNGERTSLGNLETTLARADEIFASAKSLVQGGERNDERQDQTRTALLSEIRAEVQRLN